MLDGGGDQKARRRLMPSLKREADTDIVLFAKRNCDENVILLYNIVLVKIF
jgi:hypothetical protein